ncbi:MAG TPA: hypothetical protein VD791_00410 [Burkholderiales bacterium]|nr:hypothetical protein [Burkholderiales bacterium]
MLLPGCATFRSYDAELSATLAMAADGRVDAALKTLDANNKRDRKDLLYFLERGELLRLKTDYRDSQSAWGAADARVQEWERTAKTDPDKLLGSAGSYLVNDRLRPYEGHDYEKVMLTTRMAMNFLGQGDFANARVAIKQTHEREALIAEVRARQYAKVQEEAGKRDAAPPTFKEINGYPVQEIDNPEVSALRNSYQSALSHYLAGFVYEALREPSLAAAGYRQAIELQPGTGLLEESLAGLDQRVAAPDDGLTDTLVVIESGLVPARRSQQFALPIPVGGELVLVAVAFPVMQARSEAFVPDEVRVDFGEPLRPARITSVDAMARRALQDEMPGIVLRSVVRSTTKAVAQYQAQRAAEQQRMHGDSGEAGLLGLAALALMIGTVATEQADERGWRSLPADIYVARGKLPRGRRMLSLATPRGERSVQVDLSGRHAFIALRYLQGSLFTMLPQIPASGGGDGAQTVALPADATQLNPKEVSP